MKIKTFIDRPLLSIVVSVMIVALGIIALTRLPMEKYPDKSRTPVFFILFLPFCPVLSMRISSSK